ncbi:MAG: hypothetical protein RLZZ200_3005, partial [Pseudomonadota bacterium]
GSQSVVTQFDKDDVEAAGLVKFDFLGLRTLTIIDRAVKIIDGIRAAKGEPPLDMNAVPMDDPATYSLMKAGRTTAVFQLESRGMKDLIRRLKPDRFEDVVALVALFRPGPLQSGMVDDFIERKHSPAGTAIDYLHPSLKGVLEPTYGVILYQEQVMQIAQVLSGYTLGGADLLRRAMGKKKPEEMAKQRSSFVDGAVSRGIEAAKANWIFDLIDKFAGYGFNKSHSAAYAVLSYHTAWLKHHYPAAFMAAVMSSDIDHTDKVVTLIDECNNMGLVILPPDVNVSRHVFTVADPKTIRYGLGAIRGVGEGVVESLVAERESFGPYRSLEDLCKRLDLGKLNRRVMEALIKAGSLDSLGGNRATLMANLAAAMQAGEQAARAKDAGQVDFFGVALAAPTESSSEATSSAAQLPEWSQAIRLAGERETLGLYLTGHPISRFEKELPRLVSGRLAEFASEKPPSGEGGNKFFGGRVVTAAGLVLELRKRGSRTSFILDDRTGRLEVSMFEDVYQQYRDLVVKDALVLVEGNLRFDDFSDAWRIAAKRILSLDAVREAQARRLVLRWPASNGADPESIAQKIADMLAPSRPGDCEVLVRYHAAGVRCTLSLSREWAVRPDPDLMERLERLVGADGLQLLYDVPAGAALRTGSPGP